MKRMTATAVAAVARAGTIPDLRPLGPTGGAICVAPPGTRGRAIVVARNGKKIDDASIAARVKMTLLFHRATMAGNTKVETNEGVVTLGRKAIYKNN